MWLIGVLRYSGDVLELHDRLLFISAQSALVPQYPTVSRAGEDKPARDKSHPQLDLKYYMEVPQDLQGYILQKHREEQQKQKENTFKFYWTSLFLLTK